MEKLNSQPDSCSQTAPYICLFCLNKHLCKVFLGAMAGMVAVLMEVFITTITIIIIVGEDRRRTVLINQSVAADQISSDG